MYGLSLTGVTLQTENYTRETCLLQIHDQYLRPGSKTSLAFSKPLQTDALSALGGTPDYEAVLRLAKTEMLFVLANDSYPRFCSSPAYTVLLAELSKNSVCRDSTGVDEFSEFSDPLPPPPPPGSWLERFTRIADLLPICVTISDVS